MPDFDSFARYYDADMGSFDDDLPLYRELARREGGPVLDPMCGTGRVLVALAQAGFEGTGVDIAPAMVGVLEHKIRRHGLAGRLRAQVGDVRRLRLEERFGLALVPLNSFMHLETVADQLAALRSIREHLRPGGLLALDLFNPDPRELAADQGVLVRETTFELDGERVDKSILRRSDWAAQRHEVEFVYESVDAGGVLRRHALPFVMRWLYRFEAEHLLARAGYELEAVYGDYELGPFNSDSPQLLLLARPGRS